MRISKENYDKLKNRGKGAARAAAGGAKSSMVETGIGVGAAYADDKVKSAAPSIGNKWWGPGAILVVLGHFAKKKKSWGSAGAAMCGAAGVLLGQGLKNRKKDDTTTTTTTTTTTPVAPAAPAAPAAGTNGFDAGFVAREMSTTEDTGFVVRSTARDY